eukprot:GILJ01012841.1.p1 GENE.GILJ01012841.1~~GILJ01012841.1.p1  ORF type:complete len:233 (-),score=35.62 GILJ01012841.1:96-794(-)
MKTILLLCALAVLCANVDAQNLGLNAANPTCAACQNPMKTQTCFYNFNATIMDQQGNSTSIVGLMTLFQDNSCKIKGILNINFLNLTTPPYWKIDGFVNETNTVFLIDLVQSVVIGAVPLSISLDRPVIGVASTTGFRADQCSNVNLTGTFLDNQGTWEISPVNQTAIATNQQCIDTQYQTCLAESALPAHLGWIVNPTCLNSAVVNCGSVLNLTSAGQRILDAAQSMTMPA